MTLQSEGCVLSGACACGAVSFTASQLPTSIINCHCRLCRSLSGSAFTTWVLLRKDYVRFTGEEALSSYNASQNSVRNFCRNCGTHVYTTDTRFPEVVSIPAGIIADTFLPKPRANYFVSHRAAWYAIAEDMPSFGGDSGYERQATSQPPKTDIPGEPQP